MTTKKMLFWAAVAGGAYYVWKHHGSAAAAAPVPVKPVATPPVVVTSSAPALPSAGVTPGTVTYPVPSPAAISPVATQTTGVATSTTLSGTVFGSQSGLGTLG